MAAAIGVRDDYDAGALRAAAERSKDGPQARRQLGSCGDLRRGHAHRGGEDRRRRIAGGSRLGDEVQRRWTGRADRSQSSGTAAAAERRASCGAGRNPRQRADSGGPWVVRWRIVDLCQWIFEEFRVAVSQQTLSRALRKMGYRKLSARPRHHAQAAGAIEDFKKASPRAWKTSGARRASIPAR